MTSRLTLIVARARNGVIGRHGKLPWHLPLDLAFFKRTTLGHPILMGRKTWESLGRPLPGRENIVITRDARYQAPGARVVHSIEEALKQVSAPEVFVIGGAEIYALALPIAQRVLVTEIDADVEGDTWFPSLDATWRETAREAAPVSPEGWSYAWVTYEKAPAAAAR